MKKITLAVFLVLSTISCASFMAGPYPDDPELNLLYGAYCASLITTPPQTRYYYPLIAPYRTGYSYCPPSVWAAWSPLQRSLWIESGIESELRDYEYRLQSINDMELWKLKMETQGLIDDLKREREKTEDKRSALDLDWLNLIPPKKVLSTEATKREAQRIMDNLKREEDEVWWKNFWEKWKLEKD